MVDTLLRRPPLDGLTGDPRLTRLEPMGRLSLCLPETTAVAASAALGLTLPTLPCHAARSDECAALWLGPAEWLILISEAETEGLMSRLAEDLAPVPHSLVDVSHRQTGLALAGAAAAAMLGAGCPLDLDPAVFAPGMCTRTLFGKAEIVLWRTEPERFHLEVWRSFAPYVWNLLGVVGREYPHHPED